MRIKLSNPKKFVDELLDKKHLSLKQFSKELGLNYSNLKQYRRGEKNMPDFVFKELLNFSENKAYWLSDKKEFNDNWGSVKGGVISAKNPLHLKKLEYARSKRKIIEIKPNLNEFFCEFYGALLGDGCITKYRDMYGKMRHFVILVGNLRLDAEYVKYIQEKFKAEYKLYSYYYESERNNTCRLTICSKRLAIMLNSKFSMPIGEKYDTIHIDKTILDLPWNIKKFVLRGLFDTDGCLVANKREKYKYPWVVITSKSPSFRNQLIKMLRGQNYPAYNTGQDVCVRGIENVKRWFKDIGSSNSRNLKKYGYFLKHGNLPAGLLK